MTCAPALLKFLGIRLSLELIRTRAHAEQRLFQAILVQALEDATNVSGFKKDTYYKHDSHNWFMNNSNEFQDICWGADMDPEFMRDQYKRLIREKKIIFTKLQKSWISYRALYKQYREASSKEERREIKKLILVENLRRLQS